MADVFISYSRRDTEFVRELHRFLTASGKDPWVDWEDIPPGSRWQEDIDNSIDDAESFVFVISRSSLDSEYCAGEFRHAGKRGKRIVPIACENLESSLAPEALRQLNWIWCRDGDDREAAFGKLLPALDTDLDWARAHTRLLVRAVEWDKRRDNSLLLRGSDLESAVQDVAANAGKQPAPTELQTEYLLVSRRAQKKRQRIILTSVTVALGVSVALGIIALLQRNTANERARQARSQALAAEAVTLLGRNPPAALADAVDAVKTRATPEARVALRRAMLANPIAYVIPATGKPPDTVAVARDAIAFSPDGRLLLERTPDGVVHLRHGATGRPVAGWPAITGALTAAIDRPGRHVLVANRRAVRRIDVPSGAVKTVPLEHRVPLKNAMLAADGSRLVTYAGTAAVPAGASDVSQVWSARDGRLLATLPYASAAAISPNGRLVALRGIDRVRVWAVGDRKPRLDVGSAEAVHGVVFSPESTSFLAVNQNGDAVVRDTRDGKLIASFPGFGTLAGTTGFVTSPFSPAAAFSPDGQLVAVGEADGTVRVFELSTGKQVGSFRAGQANAVAFAPRGGLLAAMTWNGDVVAARTPASLALRMNFPFVNRKTLEVNSSASEFAPVVSGNGKRILARGGGGALVWTTEGRRVATLRPNGGRNVGSAALSGKGAIAAASPGFNVAQMDRVAPAEVWRVGNPDPLIRRLPADSPVVLDRSGGIVVIGRRAWETTTGKPIPKLDGVVALSPDGHVAVVARGQRTLVVNVRSGLPIRLQARPALATDALHGIAQMRVSDNHQRVLSNDYGAVQLWDAASGKLIQVLNRQRGVTSMAFGDRGRLVLLTSTKRAAVFQGEDGKLLSSTPGSFGRSVKPAHSKALILYRAGGISPDGSIAASARQDGTIVVTDLATETRAAIQTATALPLDTLTFGPTSTLLVARDRARDVQVVHCEICTSEDDLLSRAQARLAVVSRYQPRRPPVTVGP